MHNFYLRQVKRINLININNMDLQDTLYLQYGCGLNAPSSWVNFDSSPNLRLERLPIFGKLYAGPKMIGGKPTKKRFPSNIRCGDIVKGLPIEDDSCQGIFASHVLEHLPLSDFELALENTFSILKPGGIFRFIVPDLKKIALDYVNSTSPDASVIFMKETLLGQLNSKRNFKSLIYSWFGNNQHLWMWDYSSLELYLKRVGFREIRQAYFNDSEDSRFIEVEEKERFIKSVCIECRK